MKQPSRSENVVVAQKIVDLLDEVAKLMKEQSKIDPRALEYLMQLQSRVRFLSSWGDQATAIPSRPPALWLDRKDRAESPINFIRREYGQWLGRGLSRPDIRRLDRSLYIALCNWISRSGLPDDFDLPTKKELNDRRLAHFGFATTGPSADQRDAMRLYHAARRRASSKRTG